MNHSKKGWGLNTCVWCGGRFKSYNVDDEYCSPECEEQDKEARQ